ncbi:WAP four-disulfide core domain protein 3-like, partial [Nothobranchius furzeri]
ASPRCPVIPGVMYICAEHCVDDSDCSPDEKCCYDGCGHICLSHEISKICTSLHFLLQGNCPKDVPTMRPLPLPPLLPCDFDNDCPEDEKCCLFNHQRTCVSPVPTTPRCPIIPGVMPICGEMCSSDSDCPFGEKCCDNGCGHVCLSHELVKPGSCPIVLFSLRCFDHCRGDSSCSNELKCCPNCLCKVSLFPNENFYKYISGDSHLTYTVIH